MDASQNLFIKDILMEGIKMGASDLHFSVGNYPILRIGHDLRYLENREIVTQGLMDKLAGALLSDKQQEILKQEKELVFSYNFDKNLRFKINVFYQRGFLSATLRYIPAKVPTLDELGLNGSIKNLTQLTHGLIIVSGPFGSGRSSTAAAFLEEINRSRQEYILTIEDPIEYVFANNKSVIEQREVGRDTNSFEDALKYFQEEDGDVLFLEQLIHQEAIPLVLEIASGNSLVVTTMSADSAAKTVSYLLDSFASLDQERIRDLLASALQAIICQRLIPKVGGGVKVVFELLLANDTVRAIISKGNISQLDNIIQTSRKEGMISLNQALLAAVEKNEISADDALANTHSPKVLEGLIH